MLSEPKNELLTGPNLAEKKSYRSWGIENFVILNRRRLPAFLSCLSASLPAKENLDKEILDYQR